MKCTKLPREAWDAYYDFEISNLEVFANEYTDNCVPSFYNDEYIDISNHSNLNYWNEYQKFEKELRNTDEWYLNMIQGNISRVN